jgi:hypothetical protein
MGTRILQSFDMAISRQELLRVHKMHRYWMDAIAIAGEVKSGLKGPLQ